MDLLLLLLLLLLSGSFLTRKVVLHHEEHVASQQPYVDMHCPAAKAHLLPVEEMAVARG